MKRNLKRMLVVLGSGMMLCGQVLSVQASADAALPVDSVLMLVKEQLSHVNSLDGSFMFHCSGGVSYPATEEELNLPEEENYTVDGMAVPGYGVNTSFDVKLVKDDGASLSGSFFGAAFGNRCNVMLNFQQKKDADQTVNYLTLSGQDRTESTDGSITLPYEDRDESFTISVPDLAESGMNVINDFVEILGDNFDVFSDDPEIVYFDGSADEAYPNGYYEITRNKSLLDDVGTMSDFVGQYADTGLFLGADFSGDYESFSGSDLQMILKVDAETYLPCELSAVLEDRVATLNYPSDHSINLEAADLEIHINAYDTVDTIEISD